MCQAMLKGADSLVFASGWSGPVTPRDNAVAVKLAVKEAVLSSPQFTVERSSAAKPISSSE